MEQTVQQIVFDFLPSLPIVVEPQAAPITSDAGMLPIRQFDGQIGFTDRFIACLNDSRDPTLIDHGLAQMVRQRVYGILGGYEDCNDHDTLRSDPAFKLVAGRKPDDKDLASQPTLSRFENAVDIPTLWRLHDFFLDDFIHSFERPPASLTLDVDALDDPCHGGQQLALFHGFYEQYQYLPLQISCAETKQVLWVSLRPGNVHGALGADDDLIYVVRRLRAAWPDVVIHVRGDAGFGVPWMYEVCESAAGIGVDYTFGLAANPVLKYAAEGVLQRAVEEFERTRQSSSRCFDQFFYRAESWKNPRRVIAKAECNRLGTNLRFVVSNRPGAGVIPEGTYDEYAERGESENRNKELKTELCGDRLSCHRFVANYFRLMLHAAALNLLIRLRRVVADPPALTTLEVGGVDRVPVADPALPVAALKGDERRRYHRHRRRKDPLGQGHIATWRTMLIKVGGEVIQSVRRILIRIPAHWPHLNWFRRVCDTIDELGRRCAPSLT
jgi:hypothetical protein